MTGGGGANIFKVMGGADEVGVVSGAFSVAKGSGGWGAVGGALVIIAICLVGTMRVVGALNALALLANTFGAGATLDGVIALIGDFTARGACGGADFLDGARFQALAKLIDAGQGAFAISFGQAGI